MIAGYVDAYGYLTYRTFLSFMSGNTTIVGYNLGQRHLAAALPSLVAILGFVAGAAGAAVTSTRGRRSRPLEISLVVAVLLSLTIFVAWLRLLGDLFQIATVSIAMGIMNSSPASVRSESVNLTVVTGTLNKIGRHLALAWAHAPLPDAEGPPDTHARRARELSGVWIAFLVGALLAGITTPYFTVWTLVPPVVVLFALAALGNRPSPRSDQNAR
jgi:uncharacterized membrane protein YoaK (UPF0700 family)